jgi:hypothetical protein
MSDYWQEDESERTFKYNERIEEMKKGTASKGENDKNQEDYILAVPDGKPVSSSSTDE